VTAALGLCSNSAPAADADSVSEPMPKPISEACWTLSIPLRLIEARYGPGNFDDAGDELCACLAEMGGYACHFDFDSRHPNPWYHVLVLSVPGLPAALVEPLLARVRALDLLS
jgi:hypothetical protein